MTRFSETDPKIWMVKGYGIRRLYLHKTFPSRNGLVVENKWMHSSVFGFDPTLLFVGVILSMQFTKIGHKILLTCKIKNEQDF